MPSRPAAEDAASAATMHGQVIEYIRGRNDSLRLATSEERQRRT